MKRDLLDYYATPDDAADVGARLVREYLPGNVGGVLDPASGDGALMRAARRAGLNAFGIEFDEKRAQLAGATCDDAISCDSWPKVDAVIMNPPFIRAEAFVVRALREVPIVVALLRLSFLGSKRRGRLFDGRPLPNFHLLVDRPSFNGGGTDTADVCWFVWAPTSCGRWFRVESY